MYIKLKNYMIMNKISFLILLSISFLTCLFLVIQNTQIGFLNLHSIDEYVFYGSIRYMLESLLNGNLSGLFGFGFYQYGFVYFFLNMVLAAPGILTDQTWLAILMPRALSAAFALGGLVVVYLIARRFVSTWSSLLFATFYISMPAFWYNATWFHPDWPMTFFLLLTAYFLICDEWKFGRSYTLALMSFALAVAFKYQAITMAPLIALYIGYYFLRYFRLADFVLTIKRGFVAIGATIGIFVLLNPYILHPLGWTAFSGAFVANMESNATNHGSAVEVTMLDKIHDAIGEYYLFFALFVILNLVALWLIYIFFHSRERSIWSVIAATYVINLGYLFFFVNKAWQHYYLPVIMVGALILLAALQKLNGRQQISLLVLALLTQVITFNTSYYTLLTQSRDIKAPDYTTYSTEEINILHEFVQKSLSTVISAEDTVLISAYTPFDFEQFDLKYEQVKIIFGALSPSSIEPDAYLAGQRSYWGDLKSDEELLASFDRPEYIIIRKDVPYFDASRISGLRDTQTYIEAEAIVQQLYAGTIGYEVLAENELVVIFQTTTPK